MKLSFAACEDILKILPIGYYLGHPVACRLDPDGQDTFINMDTESVTISYPTIATALENIKIPVDPESVIRGLLYHEISHALLTPARLFTCYTPQAVEATLNATGYSKERARYLTANVRKIMNIFEDERIETLCRDYYMNVDFKKNLFLINDVTPKEAAASPDPMDRFFAGVRFREASPELLDEVKTNIRKMANLSHGSSYGFCADYVMKILGLFNKFIKDSDDLSNESGSDNKPNGKSGAKSDSNSKSDSKSEPGNATTETKPALTREEIDELAEAANKATAGEGAGHDKLKTAFKVLSTNTDIAPVENRLERIINAATNKNKNRSTASFGYAGRIDPRATQSKDYRWFIKKTANGSNRRFDKIHFNLFCDNSGSFGMSRSKMNALLLALRKYAEKNSDFSVSIIHCAQGMEVRGDNDWPLTCDHGSDLYIDTKTIVDGLQVPNATVVNVVVFDGYMSPPSRDQADAVYKAFNKPNFIVVSDVSNKKLFKCASSARVTYVTDNYADTFIEVIFKQLEALLG